jgi:hypothetical protein
VRQRTAKDEPRFLLQAKLKHARSMSNLSKAYQQMGVGHAPLNNYHTVHAGGWTPPRLARRVSSSDDTDVSDDVDTDLEDDAESLHRYGRPQPAHSRRYAVRACAPHAASNDTSFFTLCGGGRCSLVAASSLVSHVVSAWLLRPCYYCACANRVLHLKVKSCLCSQFSMSYGPLRDANRSFAFIFQVCIENQLTNTVIV